MKYSKEDRDAFKRMKAAEESYARSLRRIAAEVGRIINSVGPLSGNLDFFLKKYADVITPWATNRAAMMINQVNHQSIRQWRSATAEMSRLLRIEVQQAPTGIVMRELLAEQVKLIRSLPIEAGERVHKIVTKGITGGIRAEEAAKEIARSGEVTKSRANLIARTETARAQAALTQARAEYVGATEYIWRTSEDDNVRPSHRRLNGKVFKFTNPPECDPGVHANPGETYNCRCIAIPIIPEKLT